ncbi:MAG TPA: hypothetical protein VJC39_04920 [Candidatus Nanoarchaeia archaeon]|nr:hypothetical protein [Candidatus Nanoarchaeia archaeon]
MKPQEKKQEPLTTKIKNAAVGLGIGAVILGSAVAFSVLMNKQSQIYNGPVNVPGVERVHVQQVHDACIQFSCLKYAGNNVDVYLANGERALIRDYNGDFQLNGSDTTNGLPADIDANQVLQATRRNAGDLTYISLF